MKTIKSLFFATILLATIYSCKKSNTGITGGTWSATINGKQQSGFTAASYLNEVNTLTITMTSAQGVFYPNMSLTIVADTIVTPGVYPLTSSILSNYGEYTVDSSDVYLSYTGQWNLNTLNYAGKTVKGTFNFSGYNPNNGDSIVVTNGTFTDGALIVAD